MQTTQSTRTFEMRAAGAEGMRVEGCAAVLEQPTVLCTDGGAEYREVIAAGAFDGADMSDVMMYYNHTGKPVARTRNGTLTLSLRPDGLWIQAELSGTEAGRRLYEEIRGGYIDKMSFAFAVADSTYDTAARTRRITRIQRLYDVAAVDRPAYPTTQIAARAALQTGETRQNATAEEDTMEEERMQTVHTEQAAAPGCEQADSPQTAEELRRAQLRGQVAAGAGREVRSFAAPAAEKPFGPASAEYRTAFLKRLNGMEDQWTREERAAYVHTTTDGGAVLPTAMADKIWDAVSSEHSILQGATIYRTGTVLEVAVHDIIYQGKAKKVTEGTANDDEKNNFSKVTLSGKDFSKHVDVSYALGKMSLGALEQYLTAEIARELGRAMAEDAVTEIQASLPTASKLTTATVGKVTYAELAKTFACLKRVSNVSVYATRATVYNHLAGMVDTTGRPIFQPSAQPGGVGTLFGAPIRIEDAVAEDVLLVGDAGKFVYNLVQDVMIESDRDIKKHVTTYSGYVRGQGCLIDGEAFAQLTVKAASSTPASGT